MKKLFRSFAILGIISILAACEKNGGKDTFNKEDLKFDAYNYSSTYRDMRILGVGYKTAPFTKHTRTINEGQPTQTSQTKYVIENVKAFVVPVEFTDYTADKLPLGREGSKKDIENAVFGDGSGTYWESLTSFYKKSSFGQCNISGVVTDWYQVGVSSISIDKKNTGWVSTKLAKDIYTYYTEGAGKGKYDMNEFDANHDGVIDALIMIYTPPISTTGEVWWAFRSSAGMQGYENLPPFYDFFWCSYKFFYEPVGGHTITDKEIKDGTYKADAHTLIHEFGHVLSLPDYYVTDYNNKDYAGLGCLDMMDNNIGDHNSISKAWYGWTEPYVVNREKTTIKLNSTTDTGEFIIVPIAGNEFTTLMDQYIAVEFLTPTGVAKKDGEQALQGHYPLYYSQAGVRITHVDARLGIWKYDSTKKNADGTTGGWGCNGFTTRIGKSDGQYVSTACENTANDSIFPNYKLLEVVPATGKSISRYGSKPQNPADNTVLYKTGDVFGSTVWQDYMMHNKDGKSSTPFGYTISIDAIDGNNSATITITKK